MSRQPHLERPSNFANATAAGGVVPGATAVPPSVEVVSGDATPRHTMSAHSDACLLPWIVAVVPCRIAFEFSDDLYSQGFESYAPAARDWVVKRGRKVWGDYPLLGGYVLVRYTNRWPDIFRVEGFKSMLMDADRMGPRPVPHRQVQAIKSLEVNGKIGPRDAAKFKSGDRVTIGSGAFASWIGTFDGRCEDGHASVILSLLGQDHRVVVPEARIEEA